MATFKWLPYNTPDTAVDGTGATGATSLNGVTNGTYVYGAEIDNSAGLYTLGDLELALSSAVTTVAPAYLGVFILPNVGSGNYVTSVGNPGAGYAAGSTATLVGSVQYVQVRGLLIPPNKFKIVLLNQMGVTWPATTTSTCKLYRYGEQSA